MLDGVALNTWNTHENQEYGVVRIETNILQNTSNVKLVGNAAFYNSNIASIT